MARRIEVVNSPCERHGRLHLTSYGKPACGGHAKAWRDYKCCALPAGWGTDHHGFGLCRFHGGNTPNGKREAQALMTVEAVATYGSPIDTTPEQALLAEVHRTAGHVAWLRTKVGELADDDLVWGRTKVEDVGASEFTGTNTTEAAAVNVWLDLYQRERKHLVDVCKTAIAAGIAERQVRLAEAQGQLMATAIEAILDGLGLSDEQRKRVPDLVDRHLRVVS